MSSILVLVFAMAAPVTDSGALSDRIVLTQGYNPWGPEATRARSRGELPAVVFDPEMEEWDRWGRGQLHDGDIVFRLGNTRILWGYFPLSWFIARATGSPFSHVGVVAIEKDGPVVYQSAAPGIERQPFAVWMKDNVGAYGVKRLKPEKRHHITPALDFCRRAFEAQVPFDYEFRPDDAKLYCVEFVEKAFRSQGLPLSEPVPIGDWKNLSQFPLTTVSVLYGSAYLLDSPIRLDQPVYLPGDDREGLWASRWLETVAFADTTPGRDTSRPMPTGLGVRGDASILLHLSLELCTSGRAIFAPLALIERTSDPFARKLTRECRRSRSQESRQSE